MLLFVGYNTIMGCVLAHVHSCMCVRVFMHVHKLFIRIQESVTDISKFLKLTDKEVLKLACEELKVCLLLSVQDLLYLATEIILRCTLIQIITA